MISSFDSEELDFSRFPKLKVRRPKRMSKERSKSSDSQSESDGEGYRRFGLTGLRLKMREKKRIVTSLMTDWLLSMVCLLLRCSTFRKPLHLRADWIFFAG